MSNATATTVPPRAPTSSALQKPSPRVRHQRPAGYAAPGILIDERLIQNLVGVFVELMPTPEAVRQQSFDEAMAIEALHGRMSESDIAHWLEHTEEEMQWSMPLFRKA